MFAVTSHTIAAAGVARAAADARGVRGARAPRASSARGVGGARIGGRVAMGASKASRRSVRTAATEGCASATRPIPTPRPLPEKTHAPPGSPLAPAPRRIPTRAPPRPAPVRFPRETADALGRIPRSIAAAAAALSDPADSYPRNENSFADEAMDAGFEAPAATGQVFPA